MTVNAEELSKFQGKKVFLHVKGEGNTLTELEGKVEAASHAGIAFKQKGKSSVDLYEVDKIEEITAAPEEPKKIRQKKMKLIDEGLVRQHLVDRHGMPVSRANAMDEKAARELHDQIDHTDLGHKHEASAPSTQEQAIAAAEGDAA